MFSLPNVEQKRALRTYHFQLGVTKAVNLECPNGQNALVLAPFEHFFPYKSVKNPTEFLKFRSHLSKWLQRSITAKIP